MKDTEKTLIHELAAILSADPAAIEPDVPLHDIGLDSMGLVELLVMIEKTFNLNLMESGLSKEDFQTVRSLASYINKLSA